MPSPLSLAGQVVIYALVAVALGVLSDTPRWQAHPEEKAEIMLSFSHGGGRMGCRTLTEEELADIAPNMRRKNRQVCPRERIPVMVRLTLNGETVVDALLPPSGLTGDSPSRIYKRLQVPTGSYALHAQLRDTERAAGYDYDFTQSVVLEPRQRLVIDFRQDLGGFVISNHETP
jgi:hypothetical protein